MFKKNVLEKIRNKPTISKELKQILLTVDELDAEVTTVLTTFNPYFNENCVEYSHKDKAYKSLGNQNKSIFFYSQKGTVVLQDSPTDEGGKEAANDGVEELDTKRKNKFNFCDRATQTSNPMHSVKHSQTDVMPQLVYEGNVSQASIVDAYAAKELCLLLLENCALMVMDHDYYQEDHVTITLPYVMKQEKQKQLLFISCSAVKQTISKARAAADRKGESTKETKRCLKKETTMTKFSQHRRFLRLCERMIDQNLLSDVNIDFSFYDTPSDEFKDKGLGSLLVLWKFGYQPMKKMAVTSLSWNTLYPDMFATSFGSYDISRKEQPGCICIFSLKCPSYPEKVVWCQSGVFCVEFCTICPYFLATGFADGTVVVYDIRNNGSSPCAVNKNKKQEHIDVVYQIIDWNNKCNPLRAFSSRNCKMTDIVRKSSAPSNVLKISGEAWRLNWYTVRWLADNVDGQHNFCSISADNRVINWLLTKTELIPSEIINLQENDLLQTIDSDSSTLNSRGTSISFHPCISDLFLVATEDGSIFKCSSSNVASIYSDHTNAVYSVHWNPYHPNVFLSCSADWTVKIWDYEYKESIFTFDLLNEVKDVAWAPFSSSLFAAISEDGKVHIFDVMMNKQQPTSSYQIFSAKKKTNLISVQFNPTKPVIIIGDDRGSVISFKLSPNLRSSLKAFQTMERSKFADAEREKMEKILKLSRSKDNPKV